jgi:hypothetical protein
MPLCFLHHYWDATVADVIFIERASTEPSSPMAKEDPLCSCGSDECPADLVAVRFFLDAQTLIFTGTPCDELRGNKKHDIAAASLENLYKLWKNNYANQNKFVPLDLGKPLRSPLSV